MLTCVFFFGELPLVIDTSGLELRGRVRGGGGSGNLTNNGCGGNGRAVLTEPVDEPAMAVPSLYRVLVYSIT